MVPGQILEGRGYVEDRLQSFQLEVRENRTLARVKMGSPTTNSLNSQAG